MDLFVNYWMFIWFSWVILTWHGGTLQMNNPDIYVQCVFNHEWGINLIFALYINQSTQTERHTHTKRNHIYTHIYVYHSNIQNVTYVTYQHISISILLLAKTTIPSKPRYDLISVWQPCTWGCSWNMSLPVAGSVSRPHLQSASFAKTQGNVPFFLAYEMLSYKGMLQSVNFTDVSGNFAGNVRVSTSIYSDWEGWIPWSMKLLKHDKTESFLIGQYPKNASNMGRL